MAITKIKNAVVTKTHKNGHGIQVAEEYEVAGQSRSTKWTVWFKEPHGLNVGDHVSLSGLHSDKVASFENEHGEEKFYVERSLNSPRIEGDVTPSGSAVVASVFGIEDETPF